MDTIFLNAGLRDPRAGGISGACRDCAGGLLAGFVTASPGNRPMAYPSNRIASFFPQDRLLLVPESGHAQQAFPVAEDFIDFQACRVNAKSFLSLQMGHNSQGG